QLAEALAGVGDGDDALVARRQGDVGGGGPVVRGSAQHGGAGARVHEHDRCVALGDEADRDLLLFELGRGGFDGGGDELAAPRQEGVLVGDGREGGDPAGAGDAERFESFAHAACGRLGRRRRGGRLAGCRGCGVGDGRRGGGGR